MNLSKKKKKSLRLGMSFPCTAPHLKLFDNYNNDPRASLTTHLPADGVALPLACR